jgi:hypothetical protein
MATLEIGSSDSYCGSCAQNGKTSNAKMTESGHYTLLGYGPDNGQPGCGEKWDHVVFPYVIDGTRESIIEGFKKNCPNLADIPDDAWTVFGTKDLTWQKEC